MVATVAPVHTLLEAQTSTTLVHVRRRIRRADPLDGFVTGIGKRWVLLAAIDDTYLNGLVALRVDDINKVEPDRRTFVVRALQARGEWPLTATPNAPLDRTDLLVRYLGDNWPLVTIHVEVEDPKVCFIGTPTKVTTRTVHLREVTPEPEWEGMSTPYRLQDITRIEVGGRYESALWTVAGPPPPTQ